MKKIILLTVLLLSCTTYQLERIKFQEAKSNLKTFITSEEFKALSTPKMHPPKIETFEDERSYKIKFTIYGHKYLVKEETLIHLQASKDSQTKIIIESYNPVNLKNSKRSQTKEKFYLSKIKKRN